MGGWRQTFFRVKKIFVTNDGALSSASIGGGVFICNCVSTKYTTVSMATDARCDIENLYFNIALRGAALAVCS